MKLENSRQKILKGSNIKFHENRPVGGRWVFHADRQTGGQTGMTKLRVNFRNFDNMSDNNHFLLKT